MQEQKTDLRRLERVADQAAERFEREGTDDAAYWWAACITAVCRERTLEVLRASRPAGARFAVVQGGSAVRR